MAVDTVNRTFPARTDNKQDVMHWRKTVNFNDGSIGTGFQFGTIPQDAFIFPVDVYIDTAFNAATTNVLTVGTAVGGTQLVTAGDVDETTIGYTSVNRGSGRSLTSTGDVQLWVKFAQTGTAATAGQATIVVRYALPNAN